MSTDPQALLREHRDRRTTRDGHTGSDRCACGDPASDFNHGGALDSSLGDSSHPSLDDAPNTSPLGRLTAGGTTGNERLTTAAGIVLLVLLAVIGVTILRLRSLLWVHLFVGMLLIGPIALKLASTGYRFARYYTANPRYRRKGPPAAPLRMLAPLVVISTVVVFASGVALLLIGPSSRDTLLPIHKISFFVWVAFTSLHVLGHLPEVAAAVGLDGETASKVDVLAAVSASDSRHISAWEAPGAAIGGRAGRGLSLAGALGGGAVLALVLIPQFGPWLHASKLLHHH